MCIQIHSPLDFGTKTKTENIMKEENLCFLVTDSSHALWIVLTLEDIKEKGITVEINVENWTWKDPKWGWLKIGEKSGTGKVRFIFDRTNFEHIKKAIEVTAHFWQ